MAFQTKNIAHKDTKVKKKKEKRILRCIIDSGVFGEIDFMAVDSLIKGGCDMKGEVSE